MISKQDLERLIRREPGEHPILSLFLDMSVNSDNKRTFRVFLNQKRSQFDELDSDRAKHHREAIGEAFGRIDAWLGEEFREENRGVVIYTEIGGDWFEALQFPVSVQNRMLIGERPVISPLAQVLESYHHHGVVLLDRENVRLLSVYLGTLLDEITIEATPLDAPHDIQAGGYSQQRYQRRKLEEMRHFFREFAKEVSEFVKRHKPDDLVILGTEQTIANFREFLPEQVDKMVVYTGAMRVDEAPSEVLARLTPHLELYRQRESGELLDTLRNRVAQDYMAAAGYQGTLTALQEGKVDTLVVARDQEKPGVRCSQCGFVFAREVDTCLYDGGDTIPVPNVLEEMVRLAEGQGATVEFVEPTDVEDLRGAGALLRFS
jgi:peptide chain release factor subunit 1